MSLFDNPPESLPPGGEPIRLPPPPRRRRARRYLILPDEDERSTLINRLARRAFPSVEFFVFSLLCGAVAGLGFILDAQSLLLLGILLAPLMTPWVGLTLASVSGAWRFFLTTLAGLLVGGALVFLTGLLSGLAARLSEQEFFQQASIHSHLWWPNLTVLVIGAVLLIVSFVRSEEKPLLPSVMLTYELYLPLGAAGFGLGVGAGRVWPDGALVFLVHLALATLAGMITLAALRFRPASAGGALLTVLVALIALSGVIILTGLGSYVIPGLPGPPPTATSTPSPTASPPAPEPPTATPAPTETATPTLPRLEPTLTPSPTRTPQATPVYARVNSPTGGGALIRSEPGSGSVVQSLLNDTLVEVLPEMREVNNIVWVRIRTATGVEGWILREVLATATPAPNP